MSDFVRVIPRSPLVAEPCNNNGMDITFPVGIALMHYTDAEFAAHFVPADAYERLIAALEVVMEEADSDVEPRSWIELCAAYRVFVGTDD